MLCDTKNKKRTDVELLGVAAAEVAEEQASVDLADFILETAQQVDRFALASSAPGGCHSHTHSCSVHTFLQLIMHPFSKLLCFLFVFVQFFMYFFTHPFTRSFMPSFTLHSNMGPPSGVNYMRFSYKVQGPGLVASIPKQVSPCACFLYEPELCCNLQCMSDVREPESCSLRTVAILAALVYRTTVMCTTRPSHDSVAKHHQIEL